MRLGVTGSNGRLGSAIVRLASVNPGWEVFAWTRAEVDLDAPSTAETALERVRPDLVVHCAAWTDVDGCARDPDLAMQRNGVATGVIARACAARGVALVAISTNEVFDGRRLDGTGYRSDDAPSPANPYGHSKRLGEILASEAFAAVVDAELWIVRTAWLFGPPGADFSMKIVAAARAAAAEGRSMRLVADEVGCPTSTVDLAAGVLDIVEHSRRGGILHVVNDGHASRAEWARRVISLAGIEVATEDVSMDSWVRASTPPRWGVLEPTPLPSLGRLPPWQAALETDLRLRLAGVPVAGVAPGSAP